MARLNVNFHRYKTEGLFLICSRSKLRAKNKGSSSHCYDLEQPKRFWFWFDFAEVIGYKRAVQGLPLESHWRALGGALGSTGGWSTGEHWGGALG